MNVRGPMRPLVVTVPGAVESDGTRVRLSGKTLTGLEQYARHWPGEVLFVTHETSWGGQEVLGQVDVDPETLPFGLIRTNDRASAIQALNPAVVLVTLAISELPLLEHHDLPVVAMAESDLAMRREWIRAESGRRVINPRHGFGLWRLELRYRRAVARARGLQANGWSAWDSYGRLSRRPLLFYDSRITRQAVDQAGSKPAHDGLVALFSGRWIRPKGFLDAVEAFRIAAQETEIPITLQLAGGGPLSEQVPRRDGLLVLGALDFESQWVPHVSREVDLMLIPHPQSDPSCTYLEGAGLGAPFLSYANRQASHLAREYGMGWTVPIGDVEALARELTLLAQDRTRLLEGSRNGLAFMDHHCMEDEFERRVEHLVGCAQI